MPLNDPVPSSALDVAKRNASDLDNLLQQETGTVETRTGKQLIPWQVAMQRYAAYNNTGAWVTGTAYQVNDLWESSGTWYVVLAAYTSGATAGDDIASGNVQVWQNVVASEGFMRKDQNLNDVQDKASARANLDVLQAGTGTDQAQTNAQNKTQYEIRAGENNSTFYQEEIIDIANDIPAGFSGDMTGGAVKFVRSGNMVVISGQFLHSSNSSPVTGVDFIPIWAVPSLRVHNMYILLSTGNIAKTISISTTGRRLLFSYRGVVSGLSAADTETDQFTLAYTI